MKPNSRTLPGIKLAAAAVLLGAALTACVAGPPPGTVYASFGPPAAVVEVAGAAPGPDYVWIGGHHVWHTNAYVWDPGRYERRPHASAVWVSGSWQHHASHGWYWTEGRWK